MNLLYKSFGIKIKAVDESKYRIKAVFSNPMEDRHGEIIDQSGWKLEEFLLNPVVLFAHNQWEPAIGKVLNLGIVNGNLEGEIEFAAEEYPFAKVIFNLYKSGFMRAISVGFSNNIFEFNEETEEMILKENTLYEVSTVNVPANAMALAKSAGVDIEPLEKEMKEVAQRRKEHAGKYKAQSTDIDLLSKKSKEDLIKAKEAIDVLLKLDDKAEKKTADEIEDKKELEKISADIAKALETKVETPVGKGGGLRARDINKTVRKLLKKKQQAKKLNLKK